MNVGAEGGGAARATLTGSIVGAEGEQPFAGLADTSMPSGSARTFPATTAGTTSVTLVRVGTRRRGGPANVRRGLGPGGRHVGGPGVRRGSCSRRWPGSPNAPGLVLSNPGTEPAVVTLRFLLARPGGRGRP